MFDRSIPSEHRLGFLLLPDNHAVPLRGISPCEIKAGAKYRIANPDADVAKHRRLLNVIIQSLGFRGDFGTYQNEGWPAFLEFLQKNGCSDKAGLFPVDHGGCIDLHFTAIGGPKPRQLADRIFAIKNYPKRVFLGYGVDWAAWDSGDGYHAPTRAIETVGGEPGSATHRAQLLFANRHELAGQWGFLDGKLVAGPIGVIVAKTYWTKGSSMSERKRHEETVDLAARYFRDVFDAQREGWVDVLPYNEHLVVLKAHSGEWDLLWQNYRDEEPPQPIAVSDAMNLDVSDLPLSQMSESDRRRAVHFRQNAWAEWEAHEAEQAFYDRGGSIADRQKASDADVFSAWATERGHFLKPDRARLARDLPQGFTWVEIAGRKLAISELIDVNSYQQMLLESGYAERRHPLSEDWSRANPTAPTNDPVGLSWADALAFCAWKERQVGVAVRLPTRRELRSLRSAYSDHYEKLAEGDFPWEHFPPRPILSSSVDGKSKEVPSAVVWSEPRFIAEGAKIDDFPADNGSTSSSRKLWVKDFPPSAAWVDSLPLKEYQGLEFIDAWDAYEWCQEKGWVSGRYWEGAIAPTSWGAYKNVKVTFRLVLDIEE